MITEYFYFNAKFELPSQDILHKLEMSRLEAEGLELLQIKCPVCQYTIEEVYGCKQGLFHVKCQKCKFSGPINLSYFRRQYRNYGRKY